MQFALSVRDSKIADVSQSNGFESDNCADGSAVSPWTSATFSNVTFVGPKLDAAFQNITDYINGGSYYPNNGSALGKFQAAMHLRRNTRLNCVNSLAIGYPIGVILDSEKGDTQGAASQGLMNLKNIWLADMDITGSDYNKIYQDELYDYSTKTTDATKKSFASTFFLAQSGNVVRESWNDLVEANGYTPVANSPLLNAATYSGLSNWFVTANYIGAFGANDNWIGGWTNFDPQNTEY